MEKLYFRKNGYIIEFYFKNKQYYIYIMRRFLTFLIDIFIILTFQMLLYFVFNFSIIYSSFISFILAFGITVFQLMLFKGKTIGTLFGKLIVSGKDGYPPSRLNLVNRSLIIAFYSVPLIGWVMILVEIILIFLTRGIGIIDMISRTQIINETFYIDVNKIYNSENINIAKE